MAMPNPRFSLALLPPEILYQILDDLESLLTPECDDEQLRKQPYLEPSEHILEVPSDLKSLSLVSKALRRIVINRLFRHVQLVISPPASRQASSISHVNARDTMFHWTNRLSQMARYLRQHSLGSSVRSLTVKVIDGQGHYTPDMYKERQRDTIEDLLVRQHWQSFVLEAHKIEKLTIIAPPFCLGILISIKLSPFISESLHMPYQILSLKRNPDDTSVVRDKKSKAAEDTPSIISALRWNTLQLNEGSFLRYHADGPRDWETKILSAPQRELTPKAIPKFPGGLCVTLQSFEYVAIFPPMTAIRHLVLCLKSMPVLQTFTFQTQPKGDLLHDSAQRGIAEYGRLLYARNNAYSEIFGGLILAAFIYRRHKSEPLFRKLYRVHCRDSDSSGESYQDWLVVANSNSTPSWSTFILDSGEFGSHKI